MDGIALKVMVHTILVSTKVSCGWCYHEGNSEHYIRIVENIDLVRHHVDGMGHEDLAGDEGIDDGEGAAKFMFSVPTD